MLPINTNIYFITFLEKSINHFIKKSTNVLNFQIFRPRVRNSTLVANKRQLLDEQGHSHFIR